MNCLASPCATLRRAALATALAAASCGCHRIPAAWLVDEPANVAHASGQYVDIDPRWSHDGSRIAFLRRTPDRRLQLYVADSDLDRPLALLDPELVNPDRPYSPSVAGYTSPDTVSWSANDRYIGFERAEWFTFDNGERLPGSGLWSLDTVTGRVAPIGLHPPRYTESFYYFRDPQWSPDGRRVAFVGEGINGQRVLFVRTLAAERAEDVAPRFDGFEDSDWPAWRPGGASSEGMLAFRQSVRRDAAVQPTELIRRLEPGAAAPGAAGGITRIAPASYSASLPARLRPYGAAVPRIGHLAWSPDGSFIAFTLTPDANDMRRCEVWVCSLHTGGAAHVTPRDGRGYLAPVWLGADRIGVLSPRQDGGFDVLAIEPVGQTLARRPEPRARAAGNDSALRAPHVSLVGAIPTADCDWSPDRRRIVYALPETEAASAAARGSTLRLFYTGLHIRPSTQRQ